MSEISIHAQVEQLEDVWLYRDPRVREKAVTDPRLLEQLEAVDILDERAHQMTGDEAMQKAVGAMRRAVEDEVRVRFGYMLPGDTGDSGF